MVNLAEKRPLILAILERILMRYRVTAIPPSNLGGDPRANPSLWNNTWTSWDEANPLALGYTNANEFQPHSSSAIAVMSIIFGLFTVGVMTIFALKCGKSVSSNKENLEHRDDHEMTTYAANNRDGSFPMSKIVNNITQNDVPRHIELN